MSLKGASAAIEAIGRILISVFIIGVIVILLAEFLPSTFGDNACRQKQTDSINALIDDMQGTGASEQFKSFTVQSCVTSIDFGNLYDCQVQLGNAGSKIEYRKCYEVLYVGTQNSNCGTLLANGPLTLGSDNKTMTFADKGEFCKTHLGTFYPLPGAMPRPDPSAKPQPKSIFTFDTSGLTKLVPGEYTVMISPYAAQFSTSK